MTPGTDADAGDFIQHMLDTLADEDQVIKRLSAWEVDFVDSVRDQHRRGQRLSPKQAEILERIYAEKTE